MLNPEKIYGYLISTDEGAEVYVPAASAPELEAALRERDSLMDSLGENPTARDFARVDRTRRALLRKIHAVADLHLYYGTAVVVGKVSDPNQLDLSKLAPAKPRDQPRVDPPTIRTMDTIYKSLDWGNHCFYNVGICGGGLLFNPHRYPETEVRTAIKEFRERERQKRDQWRIEHAKEIEEAREREHQLRSKAAKKAAVTRADRQEERVMDAAKRFIERRGIGQRTHCYICSKHLTDPDSIQRGIGPECWQEILTCIERVKAQRRVSAEAVTTSQA
jgi:hypothetical protein